MSTSHAQPEFKDNNASEAPEVAFFLTNTVLTLIQSSGRWIQLSGIFGILVAIVSLPTIFIQADMWFLKPDRKFFLLEDYNLPHLLLVFCWLAAVYFLFRFSALAVLNWKKIQNSPFDDNDLLEGTESIGRMVGWLKRWIIALGASIMITYLPRALDILFFTES